MSSGVLRRALQWWQGRDGGLNVEGPPHGWDSGVCQLVPRLFQGPGCQRRKSEDLAISHLCVPAGVLVGCCRGAACLSEPLYLLSSPDASVVSSPVGREVGVPQRQRWLNVGGTFHTLSGFPCLLPFLRMGAGQEGWFCSCTLEF